MRIIEEGKDPDLKQVICRHCKTKVEVHMKRDVQSARRKSIDVIDVDGHGRHEVRYEEVDDVTYVKCPVCKHEIIVTSRQISRHKVR